MRLTVEDTGPGFDPGSASRLFEPFYTTKDDGIGIGLSLSRQSLRLIKGRMWATANQECGSSFIVSIPCRPVLQVAADE